MCYTEGKLLIVVVVGMTVKERRLMLGINRRRTRKKDPPIRF